MLSNALKNPKSFLHVAQDANISNVVANKPANPYKIRDCGFFIIPLFE
jgi:hypothetical protein